MNALVSAVNTKSAAVDKAEHEKKIKDMQAMVTAALALGTTATSDSVGGMVTGLASATWGLAKDTQSNDQAVIDANSDWQALQKSYIAHATAERNKVGDLIKGSITNSARQLTPPEPPRLPDVSVAQIGYDDK